MDNLIQIIDTHKNFLITKNESPGIINRLLINSILRLVNIKKDIEKITYILDNISINFAGHKRIELSLIPQYVNLYYKKKKTLDEIIQDKIYEQNIGYQLIKAWKNRNELLRQGIEDFLEGYLPGAFTKRDLVIFAKYINRKPEEFVYKNALIVSPIVALVNYYLIDNASKTVNFLSTNSDDILKFGINIISKCLITDVVPGSIKLGYILQNNSIEIRESIRNGADNFAEFLKNAAPYYANITAGWNSILRGGILYISKEKKIIIDNIGQMAIIINSTSYWKQRKLIWNGIKKIKKKINERFLDFCINTYCMYTSIYERINYKRRNYNT
ncbi:MAG: hypothetical protein QXG00_03185 [Candidatus Woesearchaeota archaeon]